MLELYKMGEDKMSPQYNTAYEEGRVDFHNGNILNSNPYSLDGDDSHQGWIDGWCDANEDNRAYQNG